jgi:hypothetical protein
MRTFVSVVRVIVTAASLVVAAAVLFVAASIVIFSLERRSDFIDQQRRLAAVKTDPPSRSVDADRGVPDTVPLDRIRVIGTHNSYRKKSGALNMLYIGIAEPGWPEKLDYNHAPLTVQLDSGIRSFELDVRYRRGHFETMHVPLVDNRSTVPDFRLALREVAAWSDRNPGHVPITLLLELGADWAFLDPGLRPIRGPELDALDGVIRAELGSRLLTPDDVRAGAPSLSAAVAARGWPALGAVRGKIVVILHEDEQFRQPYLVGHPTLEGRAMFTCAPGGVPKGAPDAVVAVLTEPASDASKISAALGHHWLVRTRADADGERSAALLAAAVKSGAEIVSTDFPPAYPAREGYVASFGAGQLLEATPGR